MRETRNIAIVDDHTMFRKGLAVLINLFPSYHVLLDVANGREFTEVLDRDQLPDIVLLDIHMPVMDGYATASWLRAHYPEIKVMALSTMDSDVSIIKMIHHGARGYILKDADPKELKLAFDEIMDKGFYYNEILTRKVIQSIHHGSESGDGFPKLTDRELEFLQHACSEKNYQQIAREMFVSERTVDGYRESLFKKFNVSNRVGLVLYAIRNQLVKL
ncbi:MAG: response regulator transcription factor [Bacteroidota bacterium]|nr:response regulator transcription factor [Bacteroidota bacterium]MDP4250627.1 response regulator transcription factor [Bacteroidota bacterium]